MGVKPRGLARDEQPRRQGHGRPMAEFGGVGTTPPKSVWVSKESSYFLQERPRALRADPQGSGVTATTPKNVVLKSRPSAQRRRARNSRCVAEGKEQPGLREGGAGGSGEAGACRNYLPPPEFGSFSLRLQTNALKWTKRFSQPLSGQLPATTALLPVWGSPGVNQENNSFLMRMDRFIWHRLIAPGLQGRRERRGNGNGPTLPLSRDRPRRAQHGGQRRRLHGNPRRRQ